MMPVSEMYYHIPGPVLNIFESTLAFFSALVCNFFSSRDLTIPLLVAAFELLLVKIRALWTARALFMTGHRRAVN